MNIFFCTHDSSLYGAPRVVLSKAILFRDHGHKVKIILPRDGELKELIAGAGIEHIVVPIRTFGLRKRKFQGFGILSCLQALHAAVSRFLFVIRLYVLIKKEKPDVIDVNSIEFTYAAIAASLSGVPCIWHIHEKCIGGWRHWLKEKWLRIFANEVIFISKSIRTGYKNIKEPNSVLYNFFEIPKLPARVEISAKPRLSIVGLIQPSKGVFDFVRICKRLKDNELCFSATFIGGGDPNTLSSLKTFLCDLDMEKGINFAGLITSPHDIYCNIDILIHPSYIDSLPRVIMEAMAYGVPVVASRVDGIPEMVVHGKSGYLFEAKDIDTASLYVKELIEDPSKRTEMGKYARKRAREIFDADAYYDKLLNIYLRSFQTSRL